MDRVRLLHRTAPLAGWSRQLPLVGGAAVVVAAAVTADDDGIVLCPFRRCTGGHCPGCGATRSLGRLVRGDLAGAWHRHPFVVLLAVQLTVAGGLAWRGVDGDRRAGPRLRWFAWANLALLFAIWAVRLAVGDVPRPFGF